VRSSIQICFSDFAREKMKVEVLTDNLREKIKGEVRSIN
jgi:hypothetical protein